MAVLGSGSPKYFVIFHIWQGGVLISQESESHPHTFLFVGIITVAAAKPPYTSPRRADWLAPPSHLPLAVTETQRRSNVLPIT